MQQRKYKVRIVVYTIHCLILGLLFDKKILMFICRQTAKCDHRFIIINLFGHFTVFVVIGNFPSLFV